MIKYLYFTNIFCILQQLSIYYLLTNCIKIMNNLSNKILLFSISPVLLFSCGNGNNKQKMDLEVCENARPDHANRRPIVFFALLPNNLMA